MPSNQQIPPATASNTIMPPSGHDLADGRSGSSGASGADGLRGAPGFVRFVAI